MGEIVKLNCETFSDFVFRRVGATYSTGDEMSSQISQSIKD